MEVVKAENLVFFFFFLILVGNHLFFSPLSRINISSGVFVYFVFVDAYFLIKEVLVCFIVLTISQEWMLDFVKFFFVSTKMTVLYVITVNYIGDLSNVKSALHS
jgi:hypothetical protein